MDIAYFLATFQTIRPFSYFIRQPYCTSGEEWHQETMSTAYSAQVPMKIWK